jgi:hypothetical protein
MKARVPWARLSLGKSATRATTSPVRLGVMKAQEAPINTSRKEREKAVVRCRSRCHFQDSNNQLTGMAKTRAINQLVCEGMRSVGLASQAPFWDVAQIK